MKDFLKNNKIFIAIIIGAFIVGGFIYLSNIGEESLSMKEKCRELGEKLYEQDKESYVGREGFLFEPKYTYNKKLDTCLYSAGWKEKEGGIWARWIKNAFTNESLAFTTYFPNSTDKEVQNENVDKFWDKHHELFGE